MISRLVLRKALETFYGYFQRSIAPGLKDSQYRYADELRNALNGETYWLDLGCGHRIVPAWTKIDESEFSRRAKFIVGVDSDAASLKRHQTLQARVIADVNALPFRSGTFDLVSANMVVEHLRDPGQTLQEVRDILRPGGLFVFHTVNIRNYGSWISSLLPQGLKIGLIKYLEGRNAADVYPTHYKLNSREAIETAAGATGFDRQEVKLVNSSAESIMLGPVVIIELLVIRALNHPRFASWRSNIIGLLRRSKCDNFEPGLFRGTGSTCRPGSVRDVSCGTAGVSEAFEGTCSEQSSRAL